MKTKQDTPIDTGTAPAFPPEVAEGSAIGSAAETTVSDGTICDANSTAADLADVANPNE